MIGISCQLNEHAKFPSDNWTPHITKHSVLCILSDWRNSTHSLASSLQPSASIYWSEGTESQHWAPFTACFSCMSLTVFLGSWFLFLGLCPLQNNCLPYMSVFVLFLVVDFSLEWFSWAAGHSFRIYPKSFRSSVLKYKRGSSPPCHLYPFLSKSSQSV